MREWGGGGGEEEDWASLAGVNARELTGCRTDILHVTCCKRIVVIIKGRVKTVFSCNDHFLFYINYIN